jgi:heme-degrading monooxygenase HmoA
MEGKLMVLQIVRFKSKMSDAEVLETYEARAPRYREMKDLAQKYYLRFPETGEHGAVYVWASEEALDRFRESELARTIPTAYQVQGDPNILVGELVMALRETPEMVSLDD